MSKIKHLKKLKSDKENLELSIVKTNYNQQFQTAVINLEHNLMDEKSPILRKLA